MNSKASECWWLKRLLLCGNSYNWAQFSMVPPFMNYLTCWISCLCHLVSEYRRRCWNHCTNFQVFFWSGSRTCWQPWWHYDTSLLLRSKSNWNRSRHCQRCLSWNSCHLAGSAAYWAHYFSASSSSPISNAIFVPCPFRWGSRATMPSPCPSH